MKKQFNVGDLVRFIRRLPSAQVSAAGIEAGERYTRQHMPYMLELGVVVGNDVVKGCIVAFPSKTTAVSRLNIELA